MNTSEKVTELLRTAAFVPIRVWIERIEHHWDVTRFMALHTRFGETKRKLETLHPGARDTLLAHQQADGSARSRRFPVPRVGDLRRGRAVTPLWGFAAG
jgi:hypothetical protein